MSSQRPRIAEPFPGPKGKNIIARDRKIMATSTKAGPIVAKRARGAIIEDVDGNLIIDLFAGVGVQNVGHCHPKVVSAMKEQAESFMHVAGTDFYYDIQVSLAERLSSLAPGKRPKKVFFTNSGTETVEAAIKIAKSALKRHMFIGFIGAFHGRTMGALAMTASKQVHRDGFFPFMPGGYHIPYAYCFRCPYKLEYPDCDVWCAKILDELYFETYIPPNNVGALFVEPVQGEGGYVVPPKEFLPTIKKITGKYGILLVDDEIQTGMGRTGRMWAIENFNVVPDIITSAKALASGIPMGAVIFDSKLDFDRPGRHSNTFGGNPIACAAALATLDVIEEERLLQRAQKLGASALKRLREMQERYDIIGDTRGLGLMLAHEFVTDRRTLRPDRAIRDRIVETALKKGLGLLGCGRSAIRYIPPLTMEEELLDAAWDILEESIKAVASANR